MSGFAYSIDGKVEKIELEDAPDAEGGFVWVHLNTNDERATTWLDQRAHLDDYVIDALTATETRPRCDAVGEGAVINLRGRTTEDMDNSDPLASVRMWALGNRVYSVTRKNLAAIEQVKKEVENDEVRDPGDLISAIAAAITEDLDPEVAELGDMLDDCEAELDPDKVFQLRRKVNKVRVKSIGYRRFLAPQRTALEKLASLPVSWLHEDDRLHLTAAADRAARMAEELEAIRERAALTHEALTDMRAEQIDHRGLVISIAALVFLPLTFLTGLYGMNVQGLPYANEPWAFDAITGFCAAISAFVVIWFVQRHWFTGR